MFEVLVNEIIKSFVSIAKDLIGKRVQEINQSLLDKKKIDEKKQLESRNNRKLNTLDLAKISLNESEIVRVDFVVAEQETFSRIMRHLAQVSRWCEEVQFRDMATVKKIRQVYIELDTYVMPKRTHMNVLERNQKLPLRSAVFSSDRHVVILGLPGAGKTTSMKKVCSTFFEQGHSLQYRFPILFRFRDFNQQAQHSTSIRRQIAQLLAFNIDVKNREDLIDARKADEWSDEIVDSALERLCPLIVLDGFDELQSSAEKVRYLKEIRELVSRLRSTKLLLTCRSGEFNYSLDRTDVFEIAPMTPDQITCFASGWLGNEEKSKEFLHAVHSSPFADTTIKPLSLAHLCAIYERIGRIPDRPKTVYKKVVGLMLEEWDEQQSLRRTSRYSRFEADRKFEFLTNMAFELTTKGASTTFTREQVEKAYRSVCRNFGLPEHEVSIVSDELESHTGLVVQSGFHEYEFAHKSIQEYLTAEYLVKLPNLLLLGSMVERLAAELAVAVSISSNPSIYFADIVLGVFDRGQLPPTFYDAFISRLLQEKPDFYGCDEVILAGLSLLDSSKGRGLIAELLTQLTRLSDPKCVLNYYDKPSKHESGVLVLKRRKGHRHYKLKAALHLSSMANMCLPL